MNNNFYNIPNDWYSEFNNTFNSPKNQSSINNNNNNFFLATPKEALQRGNLFNNSYDPYKNYQYHTLMPSNKREELLFNLLKYKFALKEIDLYLDVHPLETNMIELYNKYLIEEQKLCNEFEKSFGPLTLDSESLKGNSWTWIKSPWPWEGTK